MSEKRHMSISLKKLVEKAKEVKGCYDVMVEYAVVQGDETLITTYDINKAYREFENSVKKYLKCQVSFKISLYAHVSTINDFGEEDQYIGRTIEAVALIRHGEK